MVGKYIIESICSIPVSVDVSNEFRYRNLLLNKNTLVIAVRQSGETGRIPWPELKKPRNTGCGCFLSAMS